MIPNIYSVGGGILLRTIQTDRFKSGSLTVSFSVPIEPEKAPLLTLLLSVLRRGTATYPELYDLNRRLDMLYGADVSIRNFYRGDKQIFGFCVDLVDDAFLPDHGEDLPDNVVQVIREVIYHPLLDENGLLSSRYVESEKQQQIDQIRALKNNPSSYAFDLCREAVYEGKPCGFPIFGTEEMIRSVTPECLTALWRETIRSLVPECFYIGSSSPDRIVSILKSQILPECGKVLPTVDSFSHMKDPETVRRKEIALSVGQSQLVLGFVFPVTVGDDDYYAATVFNELLGVSPIARLFMTVREKLGLCYSVSSVYNAFTGTLFVSCGISAENREKAEDEILRQVASIRQGDFSDEEFFAAKNSLQNAIRQMEDAPGSLESFFSGRAQYGLCESLEHRTEAIASVTREEVISAAQKTKLSVSFFLRGTKTQEEAENDGI